MSEVPTAVIPGNGGVPTEQVEMFKTVSAVQEAPAPVAAVAAPVEPVKGKPGRPKKIKTEAATEAKPVVESKKVAVTICDGCPLTKVTNMLVDSWTNSQARQTLKLVSKGAGKSLKVKDASPKAKRAYAKKETKGATRGSRSGSAANVIANLKKKTFDRAYVASFLKKNKLTTIKEEKKLFAYSSVLLNNLEKKGRIKRVSRGIYSAK